jgi:hypothetical protein
MPFQPIVRNALHYLNRRWPNVPLTVAADVVDAAGNYTLALQAGTARLTGWDGA